MKFSYAFLAIIMILGISRVIIISQLNEPFSSTTDHNDPSSSTPNPTSVPPFNKNDDDKNDKTKETIKRDEMDVHKRIIVSGDGEIIELSACNSFYDYVCLQDETTWNRLERDKTFTPLIKKNMQITTNIVHSLPFYQQCLDNNFNIKSNTITSGDIEHIVNARNNSENKDNSVVDNLILYFLENGWGFPITLKITQAIHTPKYAIEMNVEVEIYNYILTLMDFKKSDDDDDVLLKHGLTPGVKNFLFNIYNEYIKIQLKNDNNNGNFEGEERKTANDMIKEYVKGYKQLNEITNSDLSDRWGSIIHKLLTMERRRDVFNDEILFHSNDNGYFYNYFLHQLDSLDEKILIDLFVFLRNDFTFNGLYHLMRDKEEEESFTFANSLDNTKYKFIKYKDINYLIHKVYSGNRNEYNSLSTYSDILKRLKQTYSNYIQQYAYKYRHNQYIYNEHTLSRSESRNKQLKCTALTKTIMLHQVNRLFDHRINNGNDKNFDFNRDYFRLYNNDTDDDQQQKGNKKHNYLLKISKDIRDEIKKIIHDSNWLSQKTKMEAHKKLNNIEFYILRPPLKYTLYESILDDYSNLWEKGIMSWLQCNFHESLDLLIDNNGNFLYNRKHLNDKMFREVSYDIVNAWYDPTQNTITVPPGITQWPIYHGGILRYDLSSIGSVLGHELGHSIDNQGRYFDENGSWLYDGWWSKEDEKEFNRRIECLANDYGHPCHNDLYGYHTMGEDMADQMGVRSSLKVFLNQTTIMGKSTTTKKEYIRDFFINYARIWCARNTIDEQCEQVSDDVHALPKHRVDKTLRQLSQFSDIFHCKKKEEEGESNNKGMINDDRCIIY